MSRAENPGPSTPVGRATARPGGPLVAPGIATTVLYAFLFAWTEFLATLTFLTQQGKYAFPVALLNVDKAGRRTTPHQKPKFS
jgi:ABC-type glycerol-3-phosphate transport system permease component